MARALGFIISDDDHGEDLYAASGLPVPRAGRAASTGFKSWRQDRRAAFQAGGR